MDKRNIDNLDAEHRFIDRSNFEIDGMTSGKCARKIAKALMDVDGVESVVVDRNARLVRVAYDTRKTHVPDLHDAMLNHGYHPKRFAEPVR